MMGRAAAGRLRELLSVTILAEPSWRRKGWSEARPEGGEGGVCMETAGPACTEITTGACNPNPGCAEQYKTGTWRTLKPIVDPKKCKMCWVCIKYCPDSAIDEGADRVIIDMDHCKGCGICAYECKFDAIEMVPEEK